MMRRWFVVTPYSGESEPWFRLCVDSVKRQAEEVSEVYPELRLIHIIIADGSALPKWFVESEYAVAIQLLSRSGDYGDTPRAVGSAFALSKGADVISYLDADNWYLSGHCLKIYSAYTAQKVPVICATRTFYDLSGSSLDANCLTSNGVDFVDTNCLTLFDDGLHIALKWASIPEGEHAIDDRVIFDFIKQARLSVAVVRRPTVAYRASAASIYRDLGETPPSKAKSDPAISQAIERFAKRTHRSAALTWRYEIHLSATDRILKTAAALRRRGQLDQSNQLLQSAMPHLSPFVRDLLTSVLK